MENGARTSGLLGFLDPLRPRGASLHAHVVEEFGATPEEVATFLKTGGPDESPGSVCIKDGHEAPLAFLKIWLFSCSGNILKALPGSLLSLAYL